MKRLLALAAVIGAVTVAASALLRHGPEWTTNSPAALAALHDGLASLDKVYLDDARLHFQRAVEADPEFAAAKVFLGRLLEGAERKRREALSAELAATDLEPLTERERFLVEHFVLTSSGKSDEARFLIDERLAKRPKDRFALELRAHGAFSSGEWEEADHYYQKIVELAPNWVTAYNQLGYSAMSRGRFAEAEKLFLKYRFIAPDQANPRDSLAELLILLGRYEEAERELRAALDQKQDFCASYQHLVMLGQLSGDLDLAERAITESVDVGHCSNDWVNLMRSSLAAWQAALAHDWRGVIDASPEGQSAMIDTGRMVLTHRAYLELGMEDEVRAVQGKLASYAEKAGPEGKKPRPLLLHLDGMRLLHEGQPAEAAQRFAAADAAVSFRGLDDSILKLLIMSHQAAALRASGDWDGGKRLAHRITAINSDFATEMLHRLEIVIDQPAG